jgi:hypothetical protein
MSSSSVLRPHNTTEYGIVKIVPPRGWNPPSPFTRIDVKKPFATYRQNVDQLNSLSDSKITDGLFYTANSYRKMALKFENEWRHNHPSIRTSDQVEEAFLKIISERKPKLIVEYGANLSPKIIGSGFSMNKEKPDPTLGKFAQWNLNTIGYKPEGSLLGLECDGNISGITLPWLYFGMMFANFSTHVEDNHLFSINYMHQGSPKTWYGVPPAAADDFDNVCEEIYGKSRSLLRKLNFFEPPNTFLKRSVQIVHALQEAGTFIVTCPRAYHGGFSHGFNIGEAVNFATLEWIPRGIACRNLYHSPKHSKDPYRHSVFNVDSLFRKIGQYLVNKGPEFVKANCEVKIVKQLRDHIKQLSDEDRGARTLLQQKGVAEMELSGPVDDEEHRECKFCKASAFTAVLICSCQPDKTVCLKHYDKLCAHCTPRQMMVLMWERPCVLDTLVSKLDRLIEVVSK